MFGFDDRKKKIFTICSIVYAILILLVVIITNFEKFSAFFAWINEKIAILSPIVIGAIIAYLVSSLVRLFQNKVFFKIKSKKWKRVLSILCAYISLIGAISIFIVAILPQLLSSVEELIKKISDGTYLNSLIREINDLLNRILAFRGDEALEYVSMEKITAVLSDFFESAGDLLQNVVNFVVSYGTKIITGIKNAVIGFLLSVYFVIFKDRLYAQATRVMAAVLTKKRNESFLAWAKYTDKTFGGFIVGKLIDATMVIVLCSIVFSIAGIPYSILVSVFIGVCNIIPFFGPFIGAIPSGFIVFIANPDKLILYIVLLLVVQQIDANLIEPKIVGDRTGLSSLGVLVAVTVMGGYFGLLGMFLGVPIFAVVCASIRKAVKTRLKERDLPSDLSDYYSSEALSDPHSESEPLSANVFRKGSNWLKKMAVELKEKKNDTKK